MNAYPILDYTKFAQLLRFDICFFPREDQVAREGCSDVMNILHDYFFDYSQNIPDVLANYFGYPLNNPEVTELEIEQYLGSPYSYKLHNNGFVIYGLKIFVLAVNQALRNKEIPSFEAKILIGKKDILPMEDFGQYSEFPEFSPIIAKMKAHLGEVTQVILADEQKWSLIVNNMLDPSWHSVVMFKEAEHGSDRYYTQQN